jgi:exopolyphosphatase/guanosine-5'-triphosphate,3'-diphosphate pyrophosphatase
VRLRRLIDTIRSPNRNGRAGIIDPMRRSSSDVAARIRPMRVGVIDVGANTLRLLVATADGSDLTTVRQERVRLGLGEHVQTAGALPPTAIAAARRAAQKQAETARRLGCSDVQIVVTSPGRQAANGEELLAALGRIREARARVLTAEEEAIYAYRGALAPIRNLPETAAVCDVGGGSTQIIVGSRKHGPAWVRSLDIGSLRLTRRVSLEDPPTVEGLDEARAVVRPLFEGVLPPLPKAAYATGGSARAVASLVGERLGPDELAVALRVLAERPSRRIAKTFELSPGRARTLAAGTVLLAEVQALLGVPLVVAQGGLREGVALSLLAEPAVAA